jgi:hypothetical protein
MNKQYEDFLIHNEKSLMLEKLKENFIEEYSYEFLLEEKDQTFYYILGFGECIERFNNINIDNRELKRIEGNLFSVKYTFKLIGHQKGEKNSQYGTCWVWCEKEGNKKIKKELLQEYLNKYIPGYNK